jgi:chromosome partitioning protein
MGKVVVFANQKGGVGKSTMAILYANHLTGDEFDKSVLLVEFDIQKSITSQRSNDIKALNSDEDMKYNVEYFMLKDFDDSVKVMEKFKSQTEATILIDLPGNITDNFVAPILVLSDYIICPYQYETKVLESTTTFIKVIKSLRKKFPEEMQTKLIFVPNKIDIRKGTRNDLENQRMVDTVMRGYGEVTSKIPDRVDFERLTTYFNTQKQEELCKPCFDGLDKLIFG